MLWLSVLWRAYDERLQHVLCRKPHEQRTSEGKQRGGEAELGVEDHEGHRQQHRGGHADVWDEVEQESEHSEDEPQLEADEAEDAGVDNGDEERDANLVRVRVRVRIRVRLRIRIRVRARDRVRTGSEMPTLPRM